jgi:integrase/recombinase XerD
MSRLRSCLADYLRTRRALGFKLQREGKLLPQFVAHLEERGDAFITAAAALAWAMQPADASPGWWTKRLVLVRGFAKYLQTLDARTEVPSLDPLPRRQARSAPYIYSAKDTTALLAATDTLRSAVKAVTYTTLIGLLAATGIRVGEAIALDERDVDLRRAVLVIRRTKFGKSREVPLHASAVTALESYRRRRDQLVHRQFSPSFFISTAGKRLIYNNVHETFLKLLYAAGLGSHRPRPTLHDLRHSFAIQTVVGWYRDDLDVEARLPLLTTYLGHVSPSSTYWYLTAVPELLEVVAARLERLSVKP